MCLDLKNINQKRLIYIFIKLHHINYCYLISLLKLPNFDLAHLIDIINY